MRIFLTVVVLFWGAGAMPCLAQEPKWQPAAIHFSTTMSDGALSLRDIIEVARSKNIRILVPTDRDSMKWEFGLWPLRNILRLVKEQNSISRFGYYNYLSNIELESKKNPNILIIPGVESAPYYRWEGFPFVSGCRLMDWHKHVLVIGLEDPDEYKAMPQVSNKGSLRMTFGVQDLCLLWPLALMGAGLFFIKKAKVLGTAVIGLAVIFAINSFPFCRFCYDPYMKGVGAKPYQMLFDYVAKKGGVAFWAHPEARWEDRYEDIDVLTPEHVDDLWKTHGYAGFAVFQEGYERLGRVGGDWDKMLGEYCAGRRHEPVWVIAGLAFDQGTKEEFAALLDTFQTYVLLSAWNVSGVMEAFRRGRIYVSRGQESPRLLLGKFRVSDTASGAVAEVGDERQVRQAVVEASGVLSSSGEASKSAKVRVIRNGQVIEDVELRVPFALRTEDPHCPSGKSFYRLEIHYGNQLILTNPIFVVKK